MGCPLKLEKKALSNPASDSVSTPIGESRKK
jgi:hypothetical protein